MPARVSPCTIQRPARRTRWRTPGPGRYRSWGNGGRIAMKRAFVFPGQGSQAVGMGRSLADAFPAARRLFDEVDNSLSQHLSRLMFEGPESELTLTENAQPALMAASLAVIRVLETEGGLDLSRACRLCRRAFARRVFGTGRGAGALGRRCGAVAQIARAGDAARGAGRRGSNGGADRARCRRRARHRRRGGARRDRPRRDLRGGERQRSRASRRQRPSRRRRARDRDRPRTRRTPLDPACRSARRFIRRC